MEQGKGRAKKKEIDKKEIDKKGTKRGFGRCK
jgi:hypothetical protein